MVLSGPNLSGSRWASPAARSHLPLPSDSDPSLPPALKQQLNHAHSNHRFMLLLRRLKWKSYTLLLTHHRALNHETSNPINGMDFTIEEGAAETMFKIDFFEFYSLLERALVTLLGVWDIVISASSLDEHDPEPSFLTSSSDPNIVGDSRTFHSSSYHRFHANVLSALDQPTNPLHPILGTRPVRSYLGLAKEFRNRWKDAEVRNLSLEEERAGLRRYEALLRDLKLEEMLAGILVALERAGALGVEKLRGEGTVNGNSGRVYMNAMELDIEDVPLEAMVDVMEWD